ncbi:MAG TPA: protein-disulfide reductase DsbD domain-containing protein [bacterium]|nr:protein-disulfide reductase DsbD domain-containing protein [bacterium]
MLQKRVHRNYRIRDTGTGLLEAVLGICAAAHGPDEVVQGEVVRVRAHLDSSTYRPYQQLRLAVELAVREGWHIYTAPVPAGYIPLRVEITPFDGLESGQPVWPPGRRFTVAGLDEEFFVLDGTVRASIPLTLSVAPGRGDLRIAVAAHYQACSETACLPPTVARVDVSVSEAPFPE